MWFYWSWFIILTELFHFGLVSSNDLPHGSSIRPDGHFLQWKWWQRKEIVQSIFFISPKISARLPLNILPNNVQLMRQMAKLGLTIRWMTTRLIQDQVKRLHVNSDAGGKVCQSVQNDWRNGCSLTEPNSLRLLFNYISIPCPLALLPPSPFSPLLIFITSPLLCLSLPVILHLPPPVRRWENTRPSPQLPLFQLFNLQYFQFIIFSSPLFYLLHELFQPVGVMRMNILCPRTRKPPAPLTPSIFLSVSHFFFLCEI